MRLRRNLLSGISLVLATAVFLGVTPALAADSDSFRYGLENNNPMFLKRKDALKGSSFRLFVKNGKEATIQVTLVDVYADETGTRKILPLGSSAYTAQNLVRFKKSFGTYTPSAEFQYFEIPFRFKKKFKVNRPVLGGIQISFQTEDIQTGGVKMESAIVGTFAYYPKGSALGLASALDISDLAIERASQDLFPFNLVPDFPFLYNSGPINASFVAKNKGNIFLETKTKVSVKRLPFLGLGSEEEPFGEQSEDTLLLPNQVIQRVVEIKEPSTESAPKDPLGLGIFEVTAAIDGSLGEELSASDKETYFLVIFPWKYTLTLLLALFLLRKRIAKWSKTAVIYGKNFRDFQKTQQQSKPSSDALESSDTAKETAPEAENTIRNFEPLQPPAPPSKVATLLLPNEPRPLYPSWYKPQQSSSEKSKEDNSN